MTICNIRQKMIQKSIIHHAKDITDVSSSRNEETNAKRSKKKTDYRTLTPTKDTRHSNKLNIIMEQLNVPSQPVL
uniref:Uncharacterized protein n=1 Tax=Arion vulgaris TaxID=1028688 RepID=A0A0B7ALQ3_9EUPU